MIQCTADAILVALSQQAATELAAFPFFPDASSISELVRLLVYLLPAAMTCELSRVRRTLLLVRSDPPRMRLQVVKDAVRAVSNAKHSAEQSG